MKKILCLAACLFSLGNAQAALIDFEGFTSSLSNVSPANPYTEDGFTITPSDSQSAIFDFSNSNSMIGNDSDWFGFGESNTPSLTLSSASGTFDLVDVLLGPSSIGAGVVDMSISGNVFGGGLLTANFSGLTTATTAVLAWTNLVSVSFTSSDDAGIDNINVSASVVSEPAFIGLLGLGLAGIRFARKKSMA